MSDNVLSTKTDVGVIGAGTMGAGIALVAAQAGHTVFLYDTATDAAANAKQKLTSQLEMRVHKDKITASERDEILARLNPVVDLSELATVGLVIEAIVEILEVKVQLFRQLEDVVSEDCILATNTSSLSVTAIAAGVTRPQNVVGMHFFNPAPILPLVEVISGRLTDSSIAKKIYLTAKAWGKTPVNCASTPGFIVNRVARPFYGEGLRLLSEKAASPSTLDAVMKQCGGFKMGPFELMDLIGHDVNYAVTKSVYEAMYFDPRYKPSLIQKDLVDAGWLGRKSGRGFYDYASNSDAQKPALLDVAPVPQSVLVVGNLGVAEPLVDLAIEAGIKVKRKDGREGSIVVNGTTLALTDGRTATERSSVEKTPMVLFDLALDYNTSTLIALATSYGNTPDELSNAAGFFHALGKQVVLLDDVPGLAVMRTLAMLANEAAEVVHQGVATYDDVETSMLKGVNYPVGPLSWAEKVGLSAISAVMRNLSDFYGEDRYRVSPWLTIRATFVATDTLSPQSISR